MVGPRIGEGTMKLLGGLLERGAPFQVFRRAARAVLAYDFSARRLVVASVAPTILG